MSDLLGRHTGTKTLLYSYHVFVRMRWRSETMWGRQKTGFLLRGHIVFPATVFQTLCVNRASCKDPSPPSLLSHGEQHCTVQTRITGFCRSFFSELIRFLRCLSDTLSGCVSFLVCGAHICLFVRFSLFAHEVLASCSLSLLHESLKSFELQHIRKVTAENWFMFERGLNWAGLVV